MNFNNIRQCGLSASESSHKLQEDLATLFDKQMNMGTVEPPETPEPSSPVSSQPSPITYSITQHYHHSAHIAQQSATTSAGALQSSREKTNTNDVLRSHNVDFSTLSPEQIELFERAVPEQKSRLIQIWQICPETNQATGLHQFLGNQPQQQHENVPMEDCEMDMGENFTQNDAEPYMVSGYEMLAQRDYERSAQQSPTETNNKGGPPNEPTTGAPYKIANDPIYQSQRWWEHTNEQPLEHQYGVFEYMNQYLLMG